MIAPAGPALEWQLDTLGVDWYIDYGADPRTAPPGKHKLPYIPIHTGTSRLSPDTIAAYAQGAPGSYWYLGGEPNVPKPGISPEDYVNELDYYAAHIRAADPTARIIGPSILNWSFTCSFCGQFTPGVDWMKRFFQAYADTHLDPVPPVDAWAIDVYPLTWDRVPMTDWRLVVDQIAGFRTYLDTEAPGQQGSPIWVTEIASHWAYNGWRFGENNRPTLPPGGDWVRDYRWDEMSDYVASLSEWLRASSGPLNIERWFFFISYTDITRQARSDGYAGIYFFESGQPGARLNPLGEVYRDFALGRR